MQPYIPDEYIVALDGEIGKLLGQIYLYLKERLELSIMLPPSSILHGTIIADQFVACGMSRDKAYELACQIWLAVINNLEENELTFLLLELLAQGDMPRPLHNVCSGIAVSARDIGDETDPIINPEMEERPRDDRKIVLKYLSAF